ncbi:MAG TPA: hypothetical protein VF996_02490 [Candidatus Saccharimonadales bacterium]|jgi:hypothetical protein
MEHKTKSESLHDKEKAIAQKIGERRKAVFERFPLIFTLLGSFGLVATFYGFERLIDSTTLADSPWLLLGTGIILLIVTGSLYKKLQ